MWRENLSLITSAIRVGRGKPVVGIQRYTDNGDRLNDGAYRDTWMAEMHYAMGSTYLRDPMVDRYHLIIWDTQSVFPSCWSHAFLLSFHRSRPFVWFLLATYPFIASHLLANLVEAEVLLLMNSLRMGCILHRFTTQWLCELRDVLGSSNSASLEKHLDAKIDWTQRCTARP